jgi:tetratricopeptide (TPR) repeat protein
MKTVAWMGIALAIPMLAGAQSRGAELYKQGKYAEAAKVLATEVAESPDNAQTLAYLGLARVYADDPNGALDPLKKAIARDDESVDGHFGLGLAYVKLKKMDDAVAELERATKLAPDHAYAHYYLGMSYNQMGKKDQAIPQLRRFVELAPNAPEAAAVRSFLSKV